MKELNSAVNLNLQNNKQLIHLFVSDSSEYENASICDHENGNDNSSSDEEFICEAADVIETRELQAWIASNNVPHRHVDQLLKILRRRLLPSLPKCTKTLLKCEVDLSNIEKMAVSDGSQGEFKFRSKRSIIKED